MQTLHAVALGLCVLGFTGTTRADEETSKKLIGTWVLEKSGSDLPAGSTVEFTKDGKLNVVVKDGSGDLKLTGTYKLEKDKITVKLKVNDQDIEETVTIKKLTDDVLEVEDNENKVDTFKKKK